MKNRILLAALAALTMATSAWAQASGAHFVFEDVKFRSHNASFANQPGAFLDDGFVTTGSQNAFDSLYAAGIAKFDTTVSVSTSGWAIPPRTGSAIDSALVARLFIFDAGGSVGLTSVTLGRTSATAESIYIKTQVSPDNTNWFDCAVIAGHAPVLNAWTAQTTVNAAVVTFTSSTNTGLSGKMWSMPYFTSVNGAGLRNGNDIASIWQFPYVRWIISGTRATTNHALRVRIGYPTTSTSKQPG